MKGKAQVDKLDWWKNLLMNYIKGYRTKKIIYIYKDNYQNLDVNDQWLNGDIIEVTSNILQ